MACDPPRCKRRKVAKAVDELENASARNGMVGKKTVFHGEHEIAEYLAIAGQRPPMRGIVGPSTGQFHTESFREPSGSHASRVVIGREEQSAATSDPILQRSRFQDP